MSDIQSSRRDRSRNIYYYIGHIVFNLMVFSLQDFKSSLTIQCYWHLRAINTYINLHLHAQGKRSGVIKYSERYEFCHSRCFHGYFHLSICRRRNFYLYRLYFYREEGKEYCQVCFCDEGIIRRATSFQIKDG